MGPLDVLDSGRVVEEMIAEGRRIVEAAIAEHKPVAVVAAFSGGDDSIVSSHFAASEFGAAVVHVDTQTGARATADHVVATGRRLGWDLRAYRADPQGCPEFNYEKRPDGSRRRVPFDPGEIPCGRWTDGETPYEEWVLNWGFPGPAQHARMYQRLKECALNKHLREAKGGRGRGCVLVVSGIRGDESAIRAGYKRETARESAYARVWVNPFYWRSAADFELYRQEFGLPRNPCKAMVGISGECLCGAFASPGEFEAVRIVDPERADYLYSLGLRAESINGYPWGWGERPPAWYADARRGQAFLFDVDDSRPGLRPMCVGCARRPRGAPPSPSPSAAPTPAAGPRSPGPAPPAAP